jgi:hypothetical protein
MDQKKHHSPRSPTGSHVEHTQGCIGAHQMGIFRGPRDPTKDKSTA